MSRKDRVKILVATGSSGGHVFPALGFLDTFKKNHPDAEVLLVIPQECFVGRMQEFACNIERICVFHIRMNLTKKNLSVCLQLIRAVMQSMRLLVQFKPDVVVGFGSLSSVPVVILAWLLRISTVIHEQNVIPGRANRLLAFVADRIAISFPDTRAYLKQHLHKVVYTGMPLRPSLRKFDRDEARRFFEFDLEKFTILVMGGSQGSHRINTEFLQAITGMSDRQGIQVIHLSGLTDYDFLTSCYQKLGLSARVFTFLDAVDYAYSAADLVISRSGAVTVSELVYYCLPAILVPYPYAYAHQVANAEVLQKLQVASMIRQDELTPAVLQQCIEQYWLDASVRQKVQRAYRDIPVSFKDCGLVKVVEECAA